MELGDKWVESGPIVIPGHRDTCFIRGRFDVVARFDDGTYGIIAGGFPGPSSVGWGSGTLEAGGSLLRWRGEGNLVVRYS